MFLKHREQLTGKTHQLLSCGGFKSIINVERLRPGISLALVDLVRGAGAVTRRALVRSSGAESSDVHPPSYWRLTVLV
ncbi:hypothetical protein NQZ68_008801 [Dissostichus eleginoides]|nr:hypothetical protein NQZ68_008801 [Dissostichus eleginoides]